MRAYPKETVMDKFTGFKKSKFWPGSGGGQGLGVKGGDKGGLLACCFLRKS